MSKDSMALIPSGGFEMGDHLDDIFDALTVHSVETRCLLHGHTSGHGRKISRVR